eukprot:gene2619-3579_t
MTKFFLLLSSLLLYVHLSSCNNLVKSERNGKWFTYPKECQTQNEKNLILSHCQLYTNVTNFNVDTCVKEYCNMTKPGTAKVMSSTYSDCLNNLQNDETKYCRQYTLKFYMSIKSNSLSTKVIKFYGSKTNQTSGSSNYIIPYLFFQNNFGYPTEYSHHQVTFYAPDFGEIKNIQVTSDNTASKLITVDSSPEIRMSWLTLQQSGHVYIVRYDSNFAGTDTNTWSKPTVWSKEWVHYDLIDPRPTCFGRNYCLHAGKYGYPVSIPSYQERYQMTMANAARSNATGFLEWRGNTKSLKCFETDPVSPRPYYFQIRMSQGARFKSWECGSGICCGHALCSQHCPWFLVPPEAGKCKFFNRANLMYYDRCVNGFCQTVPHTRWNKPMSKGGLPGPYWASVKAEGIGSPESLITADSGHCGGILNHDYRTAAGFGWFPSVASKNVKENENYLEKGVGLLQGTTTCKYPWFREEPYNNVNFDTYQPISTGTHMLKINQHGGSTFTFLAQHYSVTGAQATKMSVYIDHVEHEMKLIIGTNIWGTYSFTYSTNKTTCSTYYFRVYENGKSDIFTLPASRAYVYLTYGTKNCTKIDWAEDLCILTQCKNSATCNSITGQCDCINGYHGPLCELSPITPRCQGIDCGNYGNCNTTNGKCDCVGDFKRADCTLSTGYLGAGDHGHLENEDFDRNWMIYKPDERIPYYALGNAYNPKTYSGCLKIQCSMIIIFLFILGILIV